MRSSSPRGEYWGQGAIGVERVPINPLTDLILLERFFSRHNIWHVSQRASVVEMATRPPCLGRRKLSESAEMGAFSCWCALRVWAVESKSVDELVVGIMCCAGSPDTHHGGLAIDLSIYLYTCLYLYTHLHIYISLSIWICIFMSVFTALPVCMDI